MVLGDQAQSMTHPISHEIQLKLYQVFIFSIPILFSIILFLLFYLFYLKRRAYILTTSPSVVQQRTFRHPTGLTPLVAVPCDMNLKGGGLKEKLPKVVFDEELKARDSVCCVCLGEFEMKEELIQVPSCKHMFHVDCISHWLQSNSTCPLCRCSVAAPAAAAAGPPSIQQAHINIPNDHDHDQDQQPPPPLSVAYHQMQLLVAAQRSPMSPLSYMSTPSTHERKMIRQVSDSVQEN